MVPPKDDIVSCKVAVKIREICKSYESLASCIALGVEIGQNRVKIDKNRSENG
jgi:hypothetical protein